MTPEPVESIRCTVSGCSCLCFRPGSAQLRSCDRCGHGWVAHALEKLQAQSPSSCGPVEVALPGLVFDLSSLVLYGAQAIPVRLKILLDRLYSILTPEQVSHILHALAWSLGDYVRGYMLKDPSGKVLDCWLMVSPEEEPIVLKQFLRFGETRPVVELMMLQCLAAANHFSDPERNPVPKSSLTERDRGVPELFKNTRGGESHLVPGDYRCEKKSTASRSDTVHFENFPGGQLLPFHFPGFDFNCLVPSTKELLPPSKLTQCLRQPSGNKLAKKHGQNGRRLGQENGAILQQTKCELTLELKADPDEPNLAQSLWHQSHKGVTKQENTSSLSSSLNSSLVTSSSLELPILSSSSSSLRLSQTFKGSSSSSLHPLTSISSSFLCPFPTSPFSPSCHPLPSSSSSLHPLPSSLCSLPSPCPKGARKGRVCCGVCGKSFYDKGTLKIHYNAVHLKIKHRCTVAGCTMVFSSLRSRNRHSANPNPRLHTGAHTHVNKHSDPHIHREFKQGRKNVHNTQTHMCREKGISNTQWQDDDAHIHVHALRNGLNGHTSIQHGSQQNTSPQVDCLPPCPHPLAQTLSQDLNFTLNDSTYRCTLDPQAPPPPPLLPLHSASSPCTPPTHIPLVVPAVKKTKNRRHLFSLHTNHTVPAPLPGPPHDQSASRGRGVTGGKQGEACTSLLTSQRQRWESGDPMPKKKPRKSSTPVKIEREKVEGRRDMREEEES